MKNGIAMISKLSIPVNSLSATASIGTCVITNRKLSTVRPSAIEIGMPVSISAISRPKIRALFIAHHPWPILGDIGGVEVVLHALDLAGVMMRQLAGPPKAQATCRKRKHIR